VESTEVTEATGLHEGDGFFNTGGTGLSHGGNRGNGKYNRHAGTCAAHKSGRWAAHVPTW